MEALRAGLPLGVVGLEVGLECFAVVVFEADEAGGE